MTNQETNEAPLETKYEIPPKFVELREKIKEQATKPLEERFSILSEKEIRALIQPNEEQEAAAIETFRTTQQKEPTEDDILDVRQQYTEGRRKEFERGLAQIELRKLLSDEGIFNEDDWVKESEEQKFYIKGIVKPFNEQKENKLGGDFFFIRAGISEGKTKNFLDATLMDAEGHGTKCAPLAALCSRFIQASQKAGVPYAKIIPELDTYLDSLPIHHKRVSFIHTTIEKNEAEKTKKLGVLESGVGGYVFWIDGDNENGYQLKIILSAQNIRKSKKVSPVLLGDDSATPQAGFGEISRIIKRYGPIFEEKFDIPDHASVFLATDGLGDLTNPKNGAKLVDEISEFAEQFFDKHKHAGRGEIDALFYRELLKKIDEYTQDDDIMLYKIV